MPDSGTDLFLSSISSIKYFHVVFYVYCKRIYIVDLLLEDCCEQFKLKKSLSNNYQHRITDEIHEEIFHYEAQSSIEENIENHTVYEGLQNNLKVGVDDSRVKDALDSFSKDDSLSYVAFAKSFLQQEDVKFDYHNTLDAFGINSDVSYNADYNIEAIPSLFEYQIVADNFQKTSSLSLEFYKDAPIFYEYGDDLKIQDPNGCDVVESNQQIYEGIHFIVHEQIEPMYDNYPSDGNMKE